MIQFQQSFPSGYICALTVNFYVSSAVFSVPILGEREGNDQVVSVVSLAASAELLRTRSIISALQFIPTRNTYTGREESSLKYDKLVAALAVYMSDNSELTISIEGVSHSEECSGNKERLGELHKVVWRL